MTPTELADRLGVTTFSFTNEYVRDELPLEQQLDVIAEHGLGPAVEIVGNQSLRDYPRVEPTALTRMRAGLEERGLHLVCLSGNVNLALYRHRLLTDDECLQLLAQQLAVAELLNAPVVRIQATTPISLLPRAAALAERSGRVLALELDGQHGVDHPTVLRLREVLEKLDSPGLGFVIDFGASVRRLPPVFLECARRSGIAPPVLDALPLIWTAPQPLSDRLGRFLSLGAEHGLSAQGAQLVVVAMTVLGRQDPRRWRDVLPRTVHVHAKFYEVDETGSEPALDYPALLDTLVVGGYEGTLVSEWGGGLWSERRSLDALLAHHRLCRRILNESVSAGRGDRA